MDLTAKELTNDHIGKEFTDSPVGPGILNAVVPVGDSFAFEMRVRVGSPMEITTSHIAAPDERFELADE